MEIFKNKQALEEFMRAYMGEYQDEFRYYPKSHKLGIAKTNNNNLGFEIKFSLPDQEALPRSINLYWSYDNHDPRYGDLILSIDPLDPDGPNLIRQEIEKSRQKLRAFNQMAIRGQVKLVGYPAAHLKWRYRQKVNGIAVEFEGELITLKKLFGDLD